MDKIMRKKRGLELCGSLNLENWEMKGEKLQKFQYLESKKSFLDENFSQLLKCFLSVKY